MDPLTSLSLTCAIVQLVDFSSKLIKGTVEIYSSATGATLQDATLKTHTQRLKDLASDLNHGISSPSEPLEKNLRELAGECQKLSDQLLRYLEKTAAKDGSLVASATAAWNSLRYKAAKKDLQSQLNSCQDQLTLYLNALMRSEMKERLERLAQSQESNTQQFASLERLTGKLRREVHVTSLDSDINDQLRELLGLSGRTYDSMRKNRILKSLSFDTMHRRIDEVHPAHVGTFDWILCDGSFVEWLSHGRGVFHIAGKPGSGKSTLMRFLCYDPRTQERLEQWAAGSRLVRANYFFWRHGESDLQNLEGLFRGLLHDSLSQGPDLIPDVLPELWEASQSLSMSWPTDSGLKLQKDQIRAAFYRMINNRQLYCNRRFCFFIDGLDEYKETTREDYGDLVQLLFEWTDIAPQDVKICTSKLLSEIDEQKRRSDLSLLEQAVIKRADGVFLWVTLILNSLRQGWADGDTLHLLLEKVNSMPPELDDLFRELLMSVAPASKQRAYLMMVVALRLEEVNCNMSALFYLFVTEFYTPASTRAKNDVQLNPSDKNQRIATARRRILAYSRGLLEVTKFTGRVAFAHRSVCDFLRQANIQNLIQEKVDSSDIQKAICLSFLAEIRALKDPFQCNPGPVLSICKADWRDNLTPGLLDLIDEEVCQVQEKKGPERISLATLNNLWAIFDKQRRPNWSSSGSLTCEAGRAGLLQYVKRKLERCPSPFDDDEEAVRLFVTCMFSWLDSGDTGALSILEFMLDSRFPPNAPGEGWNIWLVILVACIIYDFRVSTRSSMRCSRLIAIFLLRGAKTRILINYERENEINYQLWNEINLRNIPGLRSRPGRGRNPSCYRVSLYVGEEGICYKGRQSHHRFPWLLRSLKSARSFTLRDLIDQLKLPDAERLKAMVDGSSGDMDSGLGDCTSKTDMPRFTDASGIDSCGKMWAEPLGISTPFIMISIG